MTKLFTPLFERASRLCNTFGHQRELKAAARSKSRFRTQVLTEEPKISAAEYGEELEAGSGRRALAHIPVAPTCSLDQPRAAEGSYLTFVEHLSLRDQIHTAYGVDRARLTSDKRLQQHHAAYITMMKIWV